MGRPLVGWEGYLTSWGADSVATAGTSENEILFAAMVKAQFTASVQGQARDNTGLASGLASKVMRPGLLSWTAQLSGPLSDYAGPTEIAFATDGGEYVTHPRAYSFELSRAAYDITEPGSGNNWRTFAPDIYAIGGSFTALVNNGDDDSLTLPTLEDATLAEFTITYATGKTVAFDAMVSGMTYTNPLTGMQQVDYQFAGSGAATFAGATTPLFTAGALGQPYWDEDDDNTFKGTEAIVNLDSGNTLTGKMFWTRVALAGSTERETQVTIATQGNGALVVA